MRGESDHDLVAKSLQGNEKAFSELVRRYPRDRLCGGPRGPGRPDDVDDVVQLVYIKIYRGLGSFRGDSKLSTWIYQIARNEAINAVKKRRLDTTPVEDVVLATPESESPDAVVRQGDMSEQLEDAMQGLDENQRLALELRYMGERSYEEIAETMGVPLGTVKTYIHRGKGGTEESHETPRRRG